MNRQIVLANPIQTAVNPKPTKREIIEAMVQLKIQENQKVNTEREKLSNKLLDGIKKKAQRLVLRNASKCKSNLQLWSRGEQVELEFRIPKDLITEDMNTLMNEYYQISNPLTTNDKFIRKAITQAVKGHVGFDDRVQALIDSPESKKALQEMLTQIGV